MNGINAIFRLQLKNSVIPVAIIVAHIFLNLGVGSRFRNAAYVKLRLRLLVGVADGRVKRGVIGLAVVFFAVAVQIVVKLFLNAVQIDFRLLGYKSDVKKICLPCRRKAVRVLIAVLPARGYSRPVGGKLFTI